MFQPLKGLKVEKMLIGTCDLVGSINPLALVFLQQKKPRLRKGFVREHGGVYLSKAETSCFRPLIRPFQLSRNLLKLEFSNHHVTAGEDMTFF